MENEIKVGDRVEVQQAWEDEMGNYHDAFAKVLNIEDPKNVKLEFEIIETEGVNDFLKGSDSWELEGLTKV